MSPKMSFVFHGESAGKVRGCERQSIAHEIPLAGRLDDCLSLLYGPANNFEALLAFGGCHGSLNADECPIQRQ